MKLIELTLEEYDAIMESRDDIKSQQYYRRAKELNSNKAGHIRADDADARQRKGHYQYWKDAENNTSRGDNIAGGNSFDDDMANREINDRNKRRNGLLNSNDRKREMLKAKLANK